MTHNTTSKVQSSSTSSIARAIRHTHFDAAKLQIIVNRRWALSGREAGSAPRITSYQDFVAQVSAMSSDDYVDLANAAMLEHATTPYYVGGSSGTTSKSKLVLAHTPIPGSNPTDDQRELIGSLRNTGVFGPGDVAANCFMVGLFSILHHSMNRILEACCASIVPLGTLDENNAVAQLTFLTRCGVNVLVGTPGTLVQMAHAVRHTGIQLNIQRIAFTGERLGLVKHKLLQTVFPGVRVISLYGISECGFVAIGEESADRHRIRENAYFLETDNTGRLLLTCLDPNNPVPVLRYVSGDRIELESASGAAWIRHIERNNLDFNFMGNLVELCRITATVAQGFANIDPLVDVMLRTEHDGRDRLTVRVYGVHADELMQVQHLIASLPELREALDKNAGIVEVIPATLEDAVLSGRQKQRQIIDLRC